MPIDVECHCGRWVRMPDATAGGRGICPACRREFDVPFESMPDSVSSAKPPVEVSTPVPSMAAWFETQTDEPEVRRHRRYRYLVLLLTLLPLVWLTIRPSQKQDFADRVYQTLKGHPENQKLFRKLPSGATEAEMFATFPDDRLIGALLPYDTWMHFVFAGISVVVFVAMILLLFPPGHADLNQVITVAAFTGTVGILLLLCFQWLAYHMPLYAGGGVATILLDAVWLIGQSYQIANSNYGFWASTLGFTVGVGFCEEACKAMPLLWKAKAEGFHSWRSAMIWGLMSGMGFGVSEGIQYSHDSYNGVVNGKMYLVRFSSCVGLHAIWAAATGINIFLRQAELRDYLHPLQWLPTLLSIIIVPMVLHGFYDTMLKQQYDWLALVVALVSFAWLAYQIEMAERRAGHFPAENAL